MPERMSPEHAETVGETVIRMLVYLGKLQARMNQAGMQNDELYAIVTKAHDAVHHLRVELHYRACDKGKSTRPFIWPETTRRANEETTDDRPA